MRVKALFIVSYLLGTLGFALYAAATLATFPNEFPLVRIAVAGFVLLGSRPSSLMMDRSIKLFTIGSYCLFAGTAGVNLYAAHLGAALPLGGTVNLVTLGVIGVNGVRGALGAFQDRAIGRYFFLWRDATSVSLLLGFGDQVCRFAGTSVAKVFLGYQAVPVLFAASGALALISALLTALLPEAPSVTPVLEQAEAQITSAEPPPRTLSTTLPGFMIARGAAWYPPGMLSVLLANFVVFFVAFQIGRDFNPELLRQFVGGDVNFLLSIVQAGEFGEVLAGATFLVLVRLGVMSARPRIELLLGAVMVAGVLVTCIPHLPLNAQIPAFAVLGSCAFTFDRLAYSVRNEALTNAQLINFFTIISMLALIGQSSVGLTYGRVGAAAVPFVWAVGALLLVTAPVSLLLLRRLPGGTLDAWDDRTREFLHRPEQAVLFVLRALAGVAVTSLSYTLVGFPLTVGAWLGWLATFTVSKIIWPVLLSTNARLRNWLYRDAPPPLRSSGQIRMPGQRRPWYADFFQRWWR